MKRVLLFLGVLFLSSCMRHNNAPAYSYSPVIGSAYIENAVDSKDGLFGKIIDNSAVVSAVDGKIIKYDVDGANNIDVIRNGVALSPNKHGVSVSFGNGSYVADVNFDMLFREGEHYKIRKEVNWVSAFLTPDIPNAVTIWIEDSHGNKVVAPQTVRTINSAPPPSTMIFIPQGKR